MGTGMKILDNGIAVIESDQYITRWIQETGRIDHDETIPKFILPHINEGETVIDIGANIGTHTIPYAIKVGVFGKVHAFEVSSACLACLYHNSGQYPQIQIYKVGLSDRWERPMLLKDADNAGSSFLKPGIFSEEVECRPLDSFAIPAVKFIKVDCEGYELYALRGAWRTIKRNRPKMWIEINHGCLDRNHVTQTDITDFLDLFNYDYKRMGDGEDQFDMLCIPR